MILLFLIQATRFLLIVFLIKGDILVNESFITGEPDSFSKGSGDMLLSGSYVVGGKCYAKVEHIGNDNYTAQISSGAKYVKKNKF